MTITTDMKKEGQWLCLAYLVDDTWVCESNVTIESQGSDTFATGMTTHYTSFSVIVTGVYNENSSSEASEESQLKLAYYIGFGIAGFVLAVGVVAVVVWAMKKNKKEEDDLHPSVVSRPSTTQLLEKRDEL